MHSFRKWFLYGLLGLCGSLSIGYRLLDFWKMPELVQAIGLLFLLIVCVLVFRLLFSRVITPRLANFTRRGKINTVIAALALGAFLTLVIPLSEPPWHTLEIVVIGEKNPQATESQVILSTLMFANGARVPIEQYEPMGDFNTEEAGAIRFASFASMRWRTNSYEPVILLFSGNPNGGIVLVRWDGWEYRVDLYTSANAAKNIQLTLDTVPWMPRGHFVYLLGVVFFMADVSSLGFLIFLALVWLLTRESDQTRQLKVRKWDWLALAFPCILVWSIYLIAFYPALMSPDSIDQWEQATGKSPLWDAHPLFHTFLLRLISWVWPSPTAVAIFQIFLVALVLGYGLSVLREAGVSRRILATLSVLASLTPFTGTMAVTIWRDIPYSVCILGLTIMLARLAIQPRKTTSIWFWILFGVICAFMALVRYNGFFTALGILIAIGLPILFKGHNLFHNYPPEFRARLYPAFAGLVFLSIFSLFQFYFYDVLHINRTRLTAAIPVPYLSIIGAHVQAGTPLDPAQENFLNALSPLNEKWHYNEMSAPLMINEGKFNYDVLEKYADQISPIAIALTLRNPGVTLVHLFWSSKLVWQIAPPTKGRLGATTLQSQPIASNNLGIVPNPPLPGLTSILSRWIRDSLESNWIVFWRPAIYLYLSMFSVAVGWIRSKNPGWLLVLLPAVINSTLLIPVTLSQELRYMYPMQLTFFFLIGLMFLPRSNERGSQEIT